MLETLGPDAATAAAYARWERCADAALGRVAGGEPGLPLLLTGAGPVRATWGGGLLAEVCADPVAAPAVGDWCVLRTWPDHRVSVEHVLPRRTAVVGVPAEDQPDRAGERHVLVANADVVALVVAADGPALADRVAAEVRPVRDSGARPVLVLTRSDRVVDPGEVVDDVRRVLPDLPVLAVSARTGEGVEAVRTLAEGNLTLALVGGPAQGRTRLARALAGGLLVPGRLMPLPGGGVLVDAPAWRAPR